MFRHDKWIKNVHWWLYLTVILRGRAGYELIYITNEAVGYQLISGKSEKNNCFSKFSSTDSLDFFGWNLLKSWHFLYRRRREKIFSTSKISAQEIRHQFFLIWSNLTIMLISWACGTNQKAGKSLSWAKNLLIPGCDYETALCRGSIPSLSERRLCLCNKTLEKACESSSRLCTSVHPPPPPA